MPESIFQRLWTSGRLLYLGIKELSGEWEMPKDRLGIKVLGLVDGAAEGWPAILALVVIVIAVLYFYTR